MSYSYRIVQLADGTHSLAEVFFSPEGKPFQLATDVQFGGDSPMDVLAQLAHAVADAQSKPVLPVSEIDGSNTPSNVEMEHEYEGVGE